MKRIILALGAALSLVVAAPILMAQADDDEYEGEHINRGGMVVSDPVVQKECGACHMAYPARLLPSAAWARLMSDLPNHFGEDASLDEATRKRIENYLVQNGSQRGDANTLRISKQPWFLREHRGEVSRAQMDKAKTWANCQACHTGAARGMFDDD